ncbi:MAG: hypothetical protein M5U28_19255 [Sandaracinaceae bacterium]|nr:hypothetical protein [Sandaracinaceae bacterium]
MIVECRECGAPLDVQVGSAFAKCAYCGHTNKVKSAKTLMAESPAGWKPPSVWQPPPQARAQSAPLPYRPPPSARASGCLAPALGLGLTLIVALVVAFASGALTTLPFLGVQTDGAPTLGTIDLAQPAAPLAGEADGSYDASQLGSACRGYIERRPHAILRAREPAMVRIGVQGSGVDLVMAVRTSDGRWLCDDDSGGSRMPLVTAGLPAGDHRVWVGTYSQEDSSPFTLVVDGQMVGAEGGGLPSAAQGLAPEASPRIGELSLGAEAASASWASTTSGWVDASSIASSCRGSVPMAPHLRITSAQPREVELVTSDNANVDLVMLVRGPSGRIECDDDSGAPSTRASARCSSPASRTCGWASTTRTRPPASSWRCGTSARPPPRWAWRRRPRSARWTSICRATRRTSRAPCDPSSRSDGSARVAAGSRARCTISSCSRPRRASSR